MTCKFSKKALIGAAAAAGLMAFGVPITASAAEPMTIRIVSDTTGPPHPTGIAMEYFKEIMQERVPGSEVRTYFAGALYRIPEAVEAMTEGNLEMTWGQFGKTAAIDPFMNVVVGPGLLTTPGAMNAMEEFETYQMLMDRFEEIHGVHIFGTGHLSMYMGAGAGERMLEPEDFKGKKIRSMGPAENALLSAIGANPTTMAFGDVPPALQTGVIDGLLTSLGGFNSTKEQAPYFTIAGLNGIVGDYYWIGASQQWLESLSEEQRQILDDVVINEVIPFSKRVNWCNDKRLVDQYGTDDPSQPGIYIMNQEQAGAVKAAAGTATADWVKANTPDEANEWVDKFAEEAAAAVEAHPLGSDPLESTDCSQYQEYFTKYTQ